MRVVGDSTACRRLLATIAVSAAAVLAGCSGNPDQAQPGGTQPGGTQPGASQPAGPRPGNPGDNPNGSAPLQWADAYCSGIGSVVAAALQLGDPRARIDAAAQQQALTGYLDTARQAYRDALARLQRLGPPAVPAGQRWQRAAVEYYRGSLRAVQQQADRLQRLDPSAPDFAQRFTEIERSGFEPGRRLGQELDALRADPELATALQRAPACAAIEQRLGAGVSGDGGGR